MTTTTRPVDERVAETFLTGRVAVVGASDDRRSFGSTVYRELRDHGCDVVPVNPFVDRIDGVRCHAHVPPDADCAIVMVGRDKAADVVRECADRGVRRVWLFKGIGGTGSVSDDALAECDRNGIGVVAGACPLMFLPSSWIGHRIHRALRRHNGSLVR